MTFKGVGQVLFYILKLVLWGFFGFSIFKSVDKLMKEQLSFAISTKENGFEMPSVTFCAHDPNYSDLSFFPESFEELYEFKSRVKGQKLINATIMVKDFFTENGL